MNSENILFKIAKKVELRLKARHEHVDFSEFKALAQAARNPLRFQEAFKQNPALIAEVKFASPSQGEILRGIGPVEVAREYLSAGAAALSVLTEQDHFGGSLANLREIRAEFPSAYLLMKDFIIDERQIYEARLHGADVILLIVALLDSSQIKKFFTLASDLGLSVLVEVHNEEEMLIARELQAEFIGVNNRDLKTLKISLETSARLIKIAPKNCILISESGLTNSAQIQHLSALGYSGFLVGTTLMTGGQPGAQLRKILKGSL